MRELHSKWALGHCLMQQASLWVPDASRWKWLHGSLMLW